MIDVRMKCLYVSEELSQVVLGMSSPLPGRTKHPWAAGMAMLTLEATDQMNSGSTMKKYVRVSYGSVWEDMLCLTDEA